MSTRTARLHQKLRQATRAERAPSVGPKALRLILRDVLFDGDDMPDWRRAAVCTGPDIDPAIFHPADEIATAAAKKLCASCPVRRACLADALTWETPRTRHGVLGGLTPTERANLAAALGTPAPLGVSA